MFEQHLQKQIARRSAAPAGAALARQADKLPFAHALGNLDDQAALIARQRSVVGLVRALQCEGAFGALVGVGQIQFDAGMVVGTGLGAGGFGLCCAARSAPRSGTATKQLFKKVAVVALCST
ncbi:hypothetical protein D3C87_1666100 [compost metagenome]